jgi:hypothetical protein
MRLLLLALFWGVTSAVAGPIARETGAIYLSDFHRQLPRLVLLEPAPAYFELNMQRYAGTLRFPQTVQLDAISVDGMLRIRGQARQGGVAAWIEPRYVQGLPENYLEVALQAEARRRQIEELIARNEVAIGMTEEEVTRSLGRPQKRSRRSAREGTTQVFEYIRYRLIPQTLYTPAYVESLIGYRPDPKARLETVVVRSGYGVQGSTVYVKVPVGTTTISFVNGVAETIEESEGTLVGARATIAVPPVNLVW